ncbi:MAG: ABC transporter substrate-binding protein [Actinobacteria bacterium]|nr:ABC transporter substrate-binding protein [Actinomycetota bacterium]MCL6104717.1 ABC transporter substrate-binding protein [Actinomycetota bacterium]
MKLFTKLFSKLLSGIAVVAVFVVGLAGCTTQSAYSNKQGKISITDDMGTEITLAHAATRIVSILPSNAEILLSLGLKHDIVGVDKETFQYVPSPWKAELNGIKDLGSSYPAMSIEPIIAVHPDLVLSYEGTQIPSLKQFNIPVVTMNPTTINGIYHDIATVGKLTGTQSRANALIQRMSVQIKTVENELRTVKAKPTVFYDLGGLYTAGSNTFINQLISDAGGVNIGASLSTQQWPQVTAEQVVKANPQVILVDLGGTSIKQEQSYPGFLGLSAFKTNRVYPISDSSYINEPSLAVVTGLKQLAHLFHPKHVR